MGLKNIFKCKQDRSPIFTFLRGCKKDYWWFFGTWDFLTCLNQLLHFYLQFSTAQKLILNQCAFFVLVKY